MSAERKRDAVTAAVASLMSKYRTEGVNFLARLIADEFDRTIANTESLRRPVSIDAIARDLCTAFHGTACAWDPDDSDGNKAWREVAQVVVAMVGQPMQCNCEPFDCALERRYEDAVRAVRALHEQFKAYTDGWLGDKWRTRIGLPADMAYALEVIEKYEQWKALRISQGGVL